MLIDIKRAGPILLALFLALPGCNSLLGSQERFGGDLQELLKLRLTGPIGKGVKGVEFELLMVNDSGAEICFESHESTGEYIWLLDASRSSALISDYKLDLVDAPSIDVATSLPSMVRLMPRTEKSLRVYSGTFRNPFLQKLNGEFLRKYHPTDKFVARATVHFFPCKFTNKNTALKRKKVVSITSNDSNLFQMLSVEFDY
jgi:hypothetical protein